MNRAVPNPDSSPESFARLLNRLTHPPGSYSPAPDARANPDLADEDAVHVSISRDGAAALNGSRKRSMAPVRVSGQGTGRNGAEASEISYEHALRLHSRPRPAALPELPPLPPALHKSSPNASQTSRAQAETQAISALRQARSRVTSDQPNSSTRQEAGPDPFRRPRRPSATDSPAANDHIESRRTAQKRKKEARAGRSGRAAAQPAQLTPAPSPAGSRKAEKSRRATTGNSRPLAIASTSPKAATKSASAKPERKQRHNTAQDPPVTLASPPRSFELEVASRSVAIAQRQSIVSIRLNAIESEQLRQRAQESGISVSAYMRSCVLEAEHLRTQVKQALAELRASHARPAAPQLETPQLEAPLFSSVYTPPTSAPAIRTGLFGFLSGVCAIVLSRFQR